VAHKSKRSILNNVVSRLNANIDGKEFSQMPDSPDSHSDPASNYEVGQADNPKSFRPIEAGDPVSQKKTGEAAAEDESPCGHQGAAVGGPGRLLASPGS